jgi:hypothetical protein
MLNMLHMLNILVGLNLISVPVFLLTVGAMNPWRITTHTFLVGYHRGRCLFDRTTCYDADCNVPVREK